jgi:hypothetical protein
MMEKLRPPIKEDLLIHPKGKEAIHDQKALERSFGEVPS